MALRSRCNTFFKPLLFLLCVAPYASFSMVLTRPIPGPGASNIQTTGPVTVTWNHSPADPKLVNLVVYLIDTNPRVSFLFATNVNVSAGAITKILPGQVETGDIMNMKLAALDISNSSNVLALSPTFPVQRKASTSPPLTTASPSTASVVPTLGSSTSILSTFTPPSGPQNPDSSATSSAQDAAATSPNLLTDPSATGDPASASAQVDPGSGSNFAPDASSFPDGAFQSSSSPPGAPSATSFTFSGPSSMSFMPSTTVSDPDSTNLPNQGTAGPEASKRKNIGAILGGVLGGLAFLLLSVYFFSRYVCGLCGQASDRESLFGVTPLNNDGAFRPLSSRPEKGRITYASSRPSVRDSGMAHAGDSYTRLANSQVQRDSFYPEPQFSPQQAPADERISQQPESELYGQPPPSYDADETPRNIHHLSDSSAEQYSNSTMLSLTPMRRG